MSRKIRYSLVFILFFTFSSIKIFALGAGIQLGIIPSIDQSVKAPLDNPTSTTAAYLSGTIRLFRIPAQFGFGFEINNDDEAFIFGINGIFDYFVFEENLIKNWSIYGTVGLDGDALFITKSDTVFHAGLRIMIGHNWIYRDNYIENFVQAGFNPMVEFKNCEFKTIKYTIPIETGLRFHF